jgi:hypothetical protein
MMHNSRLVLPWQPQSTWLDTTDEEAPSAEPTPGDPARSAVAGGVMGAIAGCVALAVAEGVQDRAGLYDDLRAALGSVSPEGPTTGSIWLVILLAGLSGALSGAGLHWLMRRLHAIPGRLVFGAVLIPSLWIAVDAFGLLRFVPRLADAMPFFPWLVGATVYGACVALVRPVAPRAGLAEPVAAEPLYPEPEPLDDVGSLDFPAWDEGDSFLLVRRKPEG